MTTNSIGSTDPLAQYRFNDEGIEQNRNELGKTEFLELMITQMQHQDPLNPQTNSEFVAQLAQFSSVEGLENLNQTTQSMSDMLSSGQALQASNLVGQKVSVLASTVPLGDDGQISGSIIVPGSTSSLRVDIVDQAGQLVRQLDLGQQPGGDLPFTWDGTNSDGDALPSGLYTIRPQALINGENIQLSTYLATNVDSVTLGQGMNVSINLAGVGTAKLSDIHQVLE